MSQYAFLVIPQATRIAGGTVVKADDVDMVTSVDNLLAGVTEKTKIVFLVNPNNPTGTMISMDEVRRHMLICLLMCCWCWTGPMLNILTNPFLMKRRVWLKVQRIL